MKQSTIFILSLVLCSTVLATGSAAQGIKSIDPSALDADDLISYEGENVSSIELAGRPDLPAGTISLILQRAGEPFSQAKVTETVDALKGTAAEDVQVEVRPETEGVRVLFVLQPAVYIGIYDFDMTGPFSHSRLLQVTNYSAPAPYSPVDIERAEAALESFFQRNGYFQSEVRSETQMDPAHGLANVIFHIELNRLAKFGDIHITGTTPDEARQMESALRSLRARLHTAAVRPGKKYSLKTLQDATKYLENSLTKKSHLGAQVRLVGAEYNPETNRADMTFDVQTGPPVTVKVEGAHLWNGTKRRLLPIYQQSGLSPELIQEGRQNLLSYFRSKGYFDVQVNADEEQQPSGQVILYGIEKGERRKITEIVFTGNAHMTNEELLTHVSVEKARWLTHGKYDEQSVRSLQAAYQAAGFNSVKVTSQLTTHDDHMDVKFNIEEGPQDTVESLSVQVNEPLSQEFIAREDLRLAEGQPYSQKSIDDDRNKIISHYLDLGYLSAAFRETAEPLPGDAHRFRVVYSISEGPQVQARNLVIIGQKHTKAQLITLDTIALKAGEPLTERQLLTSESVLYTRGIFDWAEVDPRRLITSQTQEDVIVKVHEAKRNSLIYGLGFERVNRGGSVPAGTIAVPGLPPIEVPDTFKTSEHAYKGPRASIQYTRSNIRGKAETLFIGGLTAPLIRRASVTYSNPLFRWTNWGSTLTVSGERNKENPIFTTRQAQASWQFQRTLDRNKTKNLFLRYSYTGLDLYDLVIPELVAPEDLHTRLSTFSVNFSRDTRDNVLDARKGSYQSVQIDLNSRLLGSSVSFAKLLLQTSHYREIRPGTIWANSIRLGFEQQFGGSHVPLSERFFTGGGSSLRGFPLNGAGPQTTVPACNDPADLSTCSLIRVPAGGTRLLVLNSELRIPVSIPIPPLNKNLALAMFYDGGNVFHPIGPSDFRSRYTNTIGIGARYATPVGPLRIDIGRNLNPIEGISATQIFITLGQAF